MNIEQLANETAKRVHRAICDSGAENADMNTDGSISQDATTALINGGVWGVAAFIAQSVVISNAGDTPEGLSPEEMMGQEVGRQFVHAYRAYQEQNKANAN